MRRKMICFAAVFMLLFSIFGNCASAQEKYVTEEEFYLVFAVDHSGSMNNKDSQNRISEMLKAFIDTTQGEKVQIGYVAYNDRIVTSQSPVSINSGEQCEKLKEVIDGAQNKGETDIGIGLREACQMLDGYQGRKMIVLISDGETDLEQSDTGRTKEDSDADVAEAEQKCKEERIPIATIAFGKEYEANAQELCDISTQTAGKNYFLQEPDELFHILCDLFYSGPSYKVYEAGNSIYDVGSQKISCETKEYGDELTVLLLSDKAIKNANILCNIQTENTLEAKQIEAEISGTYALAKLYDAEGTISINFSTEQKQKITIYVIGRRNITPVVEWKEELNKKSPIGFRIGLEDRNGNIIENWGYGATTWQAEFRNRQTGEIVQAEMTEDIQGLEGTVHFRSSGEYDLYLSSWENMRNSYVISGINVLNTLPSSLSAEEVECLTISGQQTIDLNKYFADADGDELCFELQDIPEGMIKAEIQENILLIESESRGKGEILVLISDGEGSLVGSIPVRVRSLPEAYWQVLAALICLMVFCIIKIWKKRSKVILIPEQTEAKNEGAFTGKLNAYFTLLPEEMEEIPPLTFALHPIREKKIALADMFSDYPELIDVLTLDEIYLFPAEGRQMILYHKSDSTIMIGNSIVCRKMQYMVSYGNVIYITSKDGACELEVHYISMI